MLAALLLLTEALPATIPNPGFDRNLNGWSVAGDRGYRAEPASSYPARPGERWLYMGWAARSRAPEESGYRVFTVIDARRYRGRQVRFSAAIRTRGGGGSLVAMTEGAMARIGLHPSEGWRRQGVVLHVPRNARTIDLRFLVRGSAWLEADDVRLDVLR